VPLDDHPAYRQIANVIEERIVARVTAYRRPLPSEMDLARQSASTLHHTRSHSRAGNPRLVGRVAARNGCASRAQNRAREFRRERALALHDVTFLELWEAMMADRPPLRHQYAAARAQLRTAASPAARRRAFKREVADTAAAVSAVVDFFHRRRRGKRQPGAGALASTAQSIARPGTHSYDRSRPAGACAHPGCARQIAQAIKLRRSEQARIWMEKHIRDFKRGHELESIKPKGDR